MISKDEVKKIAELALLAVSDEELDALTNEMDAILEYVSEVNKITAESEGREEPSLYNVMREDTVTNAPGTYTKKILSEAPDTDGEYLTVKKIL